MIEQLLGHLNKDEQDTAVGMIRLLIATYLLGQMIQNGGTKEDKVRAAFEYADLLMKG